MWTTGFPWGLMDICYPKSTARVFVHCQCRQTFGREPDPSGSAAGPSSVRIEALVQKVTCAGPSY